jgi:hypothetical protein
MNTGNVFVLFHVGCYMNLLTYFTSFIIMELPLTEVKYLQGPHRTVSCQLFCKKTFCLSVRNRNSF